MKCVSLLFLMGVPSLVWSQEVGQGAPAGIAQQFVQAYFRNGFNSLVSSTPASAVRTFGTGGYLQEFNDAKNSSVKYALVKGADAAAPVAQIYPAMYSHYGTVGVANAGFPTIDTSGCTPIGNVSGVCMYQLFDNNYALFVYAASMTAANDTASYTVKDPFYTRWAAIGAITGIGAATSAETAITSRLNTTATGQQFAAGALYNITSGAFTGKTFPVKGKIFTLYSINGLHGGALGLPLSEELVASGGKIRQNFEGGQIEYSATTDPVIRPAVGGVQLSIATGEVTRMNIGDTLNVRVSVVATTGESLTDREVTWTTSNSRVVSITPAGLGATAVLRAAGGGTAIITAVSEGKTSDRVTIFVSSPCCQIGEGAPTAAIQQSFQDAVTRQRLTVKLPAANPVMRLGSGYVQELVSADGTQRYLLCRSDRSPGVFLVTGDLLRAYELEGGPAGKLAYPTLDATAGGRQVFEGGILAGSPVYVVSGVIATRWAALGYESGVMGPPAGAPASALSFRGVKGTIQLFRNGALVAGEGSSARTFVVSGPILAKYVGTGGIGGVLGMPIGEEYAQSGERRQDFEGGALHYAPGDAEAQLDELDRRPQITVSPSRVTAGGRVRIAVGGFPSQSAIRVTLSGEGVGSPFTVQTENGSYVWEVPVARTVASGFVNIRAQEMNGATSATGSYTVTALEEAGARLTRSRGDTQTGLPGAKLLNPLVAALKDSDGTPLVGAPVTFAASPGAEIISATALTDESGEAQAFVRLPLSDGIALYTAEAAGVITTFSARSAASTLPNYPKQAQNANGSLVAATASMIRYLQNRGELPSSLGQADPAVLNDFLKNFCPLDVIGGRICDGYLSVGGGQVVNLWRLRDFVGGLLNVQILTASNDAPIRDALAEGRPVLVALRLTSGSALLGTHFVVAIGADIDGSLVMHDPAGNRTRLNDYFAGVRLGNQEVKGEILDAVALLPQSSSPTGFLVTSRSSRTAVRSRTGDCGRLLDWPGAAVVSATGASASTAGSTQMYYCDGVQSTYSSAVTGAVTLTDLGSPGRQNSVPSPGEYLVTRPSAQWQVDPLQVTISADVVNAATLTADLAPGSLALVYGTGLSKDGAGTRVEVGGIEARVQKAEDFRLFVEIPPSLTAGVHPLVVQSPSGSAQAMIRLQEIAPFIFVDEKTKAPAISSNDGRANTALTPALRGEAVRIAATGLGAVKPQGNQQVAEKQIFVVLQGVEYAASSAVLSADLPGVYTVTVAIPADAVPGLSLGLQLRVEGADSNRVEVSLR